MDGFGLECGDFNTIVYCNLYFVPRIFVFSKFEGNMEITIGCHIIYLFFYIYIKLGGNCRVLNKKREIYEHQNCSKKVKGLKLHNLDTWVVKSGIVQTKKQNTNVHTK